MLQGGINTGNSSNDSCEVRSAIPEMAATNPWCNTSTGWVTRMTALGSYTIPRLDVQVAGTIRSDQGAPLAANWTAPNSATVGLNRAFAGVGGQILRLGRTRATVGLDVYNLPNSASVLTYNQTFVPTTTTWLRPTSVLQPRFVKFSAQVDF
jgi:hypothetical protein